MRKTSRRGRRTGRGIYPAVRGDGLGELSAIWLLRAIALTRYGRRWFNETGNVEAHHIAEKLGVGRTTFEKRNSLTNPIEDKVADLVDCLLGDEAVKDGKPHRRDIERGLKQALARFGHDQALEAGPVFCNLTELANALGLKRVERRFLGFTVASVADASLADLFDHVPWTSATQFAQFAATILQERPSDILQIMQYDSALSQTGLVRFRSPSRWGDPPFELMPELELMMVGDLSQAAEFFERFYSAPAPTNLKIDDYPHLQLPIRAIVGVLRGALKSRTRGVNVLLYGIPGGGKTELAKAIGEAIGATVYSVGARPEGRDLDGTRVNCLKVSQALLRKRRDVVLMFDELEDITPAEWTPLGVNRRSFTDKAKMHRILEDNPVPTIWISNRVRHIDESVIRRFEVCLEVPRLPQSLIAPLLSARLEPKGVKPKTIQAISRNEHFTQADAERLFRVLNVGKISRADADRIARLFATETLKARGCSFVEPANHPPVLSFQLEFLNTTPSFEQLVENLDPKTKASLCFYGPPGTGKTAFAHYLAKHLDVKLLKKAASDLLSKWLGETEQNIAAMFREAREEQAILLLDEADSFLRDRQGAIRSWEVTQVNELLVQMEGFNGIFICSTNLFDQLDAASLRRFDLKLKFENLSAKQRINLFEQLLNISGVRRPTGRIAQQVARRLNQLEGLAPGDYATVARQRSFFLKNAEVEECLVALEKELEAKEGQRRSKIGFTSQ